MPSRRQTILLASALLSLASVPALAHAHLVKALPAAGGTLHDPPSEVTLRFNEKLEPAFSSVIVRDAAGKQIDKGDGKVDNADRMLIRVTLPPSSPASTRSSGARCRRTPTRSTATSPSRSANSVASQPRCAGRSELSDPLVWVRFLHFAATVSLSGLVIFHAFVGAPALSAGGATPRWCA